ncbi:MAG TPA: ATP-binding cassette domain-containing protein, partial [Anaeromyxobacteraceae bacterium]|nr:ATP-binding cassette domain-containing protein [Anaeromyxobacteraceae bacterium]
MSATIVLEQVTVMHGERRALADVSLRIVAGETLSVLGSSGSGKTTLLRAVAGFVTPDVGMIRIGDAVASESGRSILP